MAQDSATNPTDSDQLIDNVVKYIEGKPDLVDKLKELLKDNKDFKKIVEKSEDVPGKDIVELLKGNENLSKGAIDIVEKYLEQDRTALAEFFEQANKIEGEGMEGKLEALGDQLLINRIIGGAALTTLTGALAGTLAIGGVAGALITGGAALAGFLAILAIAAIAYVVYQQRGEIKERAEDIGKGIVHLLKNFVDKISPDLPNTLRYLKPFYAEQIGENAERIKAGNPLPDDAAFIMQYLLNEDGFDALKKLIEESKGKKMTVKDGDKNIELTLDDLTRLKEKGSSTFRDDIGEFKRELSNFKLLMSEKNQDTRKQVEAKQDEIHESKKLKTPLPSSALYPGSIANNELLASVGKNERKDTRDLLRNIANLTDQFRKEKGGIYEVLSGDSYNLNRTKLDHLEKKGSEVENNLQELAVEFNKLSADDVKELNKKVNELKEEQWKGPKTKTEPVQGTESVASPGKQTQLS